MRINMIKLVIALSYIICPIIYYPVLVENKAPIIIGVIMWLFSPAAVGFYAIVKTVEFLLQFTF